MDGKSWGAICSAGIYTKKLTIQNQFKVERTDIRDICNAVSRSVSLDSIAITNCGLTDVDLLEIITGCVAEHPSLTKVDFRNNVMTAKESELGLIKAIAKNPRIHTISTSSLSGKTLTNSKERFGWFRIRQPQKSTADAMLEFLVSNDTVVCLYESVGLSQNTLGGIWPKNLMEYNVHGTVQYMNKGQDARVESMAKGIYSGCLLCCTEDEATDIKQRIPAILAIAEYTGSRSFIISQYMEAARSRPQTFSMPDIENFMTRSDRMHVGLSASPGRPYKFKVINGGASALKR